MIRPLAKSDEAVLGALLRSAGGSMVTGRDCGTSRLAKATGQREETVKAALARLALRRIVVVIEEPRGSLSRVYRICPAAFGEGAEA